MKTVIISPHVDDAIFSLGEYIQRLEDVTILSVFSGVPDDVEGMQKHILLRREHEEACKVMGVKWINGNFLDDVYDPRPDEDKVALWIERKLVDIAPDKIVAPLGIHHPDHVMVRNISMQYFKIDNFYRELPYAKLYRPLAEGLERLIPGYHKSYMSTDREKKRIAVNCYKSQLQNNHIMEEVLSDELIYSL